MKGLQRVADTSPPVPGKPCRQKTWCLKGGYVPVKDRSKKLLLSRVAPERRTLELFATTTSCVCNGHVKGNAAGGVDQHVCAKPLASMCDSMPSLRSACFYTSSAWLGTDMLSVERQRLCQSTSAPAGCLGAGGPTSARVKPVESTAEAADNQHGYRRH